jgi:hypothetical protein
MALYWPQGRYHQIWEANLQPLGPKNRPKDAQSWPQVWWVLAGLFTLTGPKNSRRWRRVCFPPRSAIFRSRMGCVHPFQSAPFLSFSGDVWKLSWTRCLQDHLDVVKSFFLSSALYYYYLLKLFVIQGHELQGLNPVASSHGPNS